MIRHTSSLGRLAFAVAVALAAAPSLAGITAVKAAPPVEAGTIDVLSHLYGGTFVSSGSDFANGSVVATRIDDFNDQIWSGKSFTASAVARFSDTAQTFGYFDGGGAFQSVFETVGTGFNVTGSGTFTPNVDSFALGRRGDGTTQSSEDISNADGRDHLITYEVRRGDATPIWLLFWEDLDRVEGMAKGRSADDFNDFVVSLSATDATAPVAVPLPPAAWPGVITAGLGGLVMLRRKLARSR